MTGLIITVKGDLDYRATRLRVIALFSKSSKPRLCLQDFKFKPRISCNTGGLLASTMNT